MSVTVATEPGTPPARAARVAGLDLARAFAVLGMLIAHGGSPWSSEPGGWTTSLVKSTDGRAMPLFVVLMGAGGALLLRRHAHPWRAVIGRAVLLLLVGLAFELTTIVAVILHFYALFLLFAPLLRRVPDRWLLVGAGVVTVVSVWTMRAWSASWPSVYDHWLDSADRWGALNLLAHPVALLSTVAVTGMYPFFPTFAFVLVGTWIGRQDLRSARLQVGMAAVGVPMAVVGYGLGWATDDRREPFTAVVDRGQDTWWRVLDAAGHSQMPAWVVGATGCSLVIVAACLWAADRFPAVTHPLVLVGQLALTVYVGHLAVLRWWLEDWPWSLGPAEGLAIVVAFFGGCVGFAVLWRRRFARGPLEAVLHRV